MIQAVEVKVMNLAKKYVKFVEAKHDPGKLCCPGTALITFPNILFVRLTIICCINGSIYLMKLGILIEGSEWNYRMQEPYF